MVLLVLVLNVGISFIFSHVYPSHCVRPSHVPKGDPPSVEEQSVSPVDIREISIEELEVPPELFVKVETSLLPLAEKDVIVRSAYVNVHPGKHDSEYQNSLIILLEIKKSLLNEKALEKCGVGEYVSAKFEVTTENLSVFQSQIIFLLCSSGSANWSRKVWQFNTCSGSPLLP